ncbi:hypothetical protein [Cupriavidus pauculus]|uniref:hypothetical protein n=1 Tax=Cupriavidus pauculus TaxID=82633 RepID=UPI001EE21107|nr:hypothetical protein [Cupriavidus pauculus]GJG93522.1 hypothetical protein CBA19C6_03555 [Cupriavidus pauculus]
MRRRLEPARQLQRSQRLVERVGIDTLADVDHVQHGIAFRIDPDTLARYPAIRQRQSMPAQQFVRCIEMRGFERGGIHRGANLRNAFLTAGRRITAQRRYHRWVGHMVQHHFHHRLSLSIRYPHWMTEILCTMPPEKPSGQANQIRLNVGLPNDQIACYSAMRER